MDALVSVIIPTYNRSGLLREALRSVLAQSFTDYEVIVVDDGSEEDIAGVVAAGGGPAARCMRVPHGGPGAARNAGVQAARGELIAFLDSDDLWHPEHLARTVPVLRERPEVGLVYHGAIAIDESGRELPEGRSRAFAAGRVTQDLFVYDFVLTPSVVCRREVFDAVGGFDGALMSSEDYELWLRMSLVCEFARVGEPLMYRRRHAGSICASRRGRNAILRAIVKERFRREYEATIEPRVALAALGKAFLHAGRYVWREGHRASARRLARQALRYQPGNVKALGLLAAIWLWRWRRAVGPDPLLEAEEAVGRRVGGRIGRGRHPRGLPDRGEVANHGGTETRRWDR
jgi:glycosyltransferase involved in cell wall biosynthesis